VQQFLAWKNISAISKPQEDTFRNHGEYQIESDGRTSEDSKTSLPPMLQTMAESVE
jgi:hypothetical protein